jgi:hypothetical protein
MAARAMAARWHAMRSSGCEAQGRTSYPSAVSATVMGRRLGSLASLQVKRCSCNRRRTRGSSR